MRHQRRIHIPFCYTENFIEKYQTRKRGGMKWGTKHDFCAKKRRKYVLRFAKARVLWDKTQHIWTQNNAYCKAKCCILRGKTHGIASEKRGKESDNRCKSLNDNGLAIASYFFIFRATTCFLSRRWPFSGVKENQNVSKMATDGGIVIRATLRRCAMEAI